MIAELPNLGPKSEAMLHRAGIKTESQLRALGAVRAFVKVRENGASPSLNLLWALEGALTNRPWQTVAREDRLALLLELEKHPADKDSGLSARAGSSVSRTKSAAASRSPKR